MASDQPQVPADAGPPPALPEAGSRAGDPPAVEAPAFVSLDRRVIWRWRVTGLLGAGVLMIPLLIGCLLAAGAWLGRPWAGLALWTGVGAVLAAWHLWYPSRAYHAWGYRLDERVLEIRQGVWWRKTALLPLSRLQHVDLRRGPFERLQGLASLILYTAGTQESALLVPGLEAEEAVRLRDRLVTVGGDDAV